MVRMRYDGTHYHGWQVQENAITVQETFQNALEKIFGERLSVTGCSRTDSGVHAMMYCCNFRTESTIPCEKIPYALNAHLPDDIGVYDCAEVPMDFHARYSCRGKRYIYKFWNSPFRNPFQMGYATPYRPKLDADFLNRQAKDFIGRHDFAAFAAAGGSVEDTVRTVEDACVYRDGDLVCFEVQADGFLYNMVRIMAGTLIAVSEGKIAPGSIPQIIDGLDRAKAGPTAPAQGLYLKEVFY